MADDDNAKTCKVVLLGDSGVGKTCLIYRFFEETFISSYLSTIGFDLKKKTVRNIFDGKPSVIINKGKINIKEMIKAVLLQIASQDLEK